MNTFGILEDVKQKLSDSKIRAKTLKIGLETLLNPDEFPIARIAPKSQELDQFDGWAQDVFFTITIGSLKNDLKPSAHLITIYQLSDDIFAALHNTQPQFGGLYRFISSSIKEDANYAFLECFYKLESVRI